MILCSSGLGNQIYTVAYLNKDGSMAVALLLYFLASQGLLVASPAVVVSLAAAAVWSEIYAVWFTKYYTDKRARNAQTDKGVDNP